MIWRHGHNARSLNSYLSLLRLWFEMHASVDNIPDVAVLPSALGSYKGHLSWLCFHLGWVREQACVLSLVDSGLQCSIQLQSQSKSSMEIRAAIARLSGIPAVRTSARLCDRSFYRKSPVHMLSVFCASSHSFSIWHVYFWTISERKILDVIIIVRLDYFIHFALN